jgi:hypothetical protein
MPSGTIAASWRSLGAALVHADGRDGFPGDFQSESEGAAGARAPTVIITPTKQPDGGLKPLSPVVHAS